MTSNSQEISNLSTQQQNILEGLMRLRKYDSPLVQGISYSSNGNGLSITVRRTCRGERRFLDDLNNYFENTCSDLTVCGTFFDERTGDIEFYFEDGTVIDFTRKRFNPKKRHFCKSSCKRIFSKWN